LVPVCRASFFWFRGAGAASAFSTCCGPAFPAAIFPPYHRKLLPCHQGSPAHRHTIRATGITTYLKNGGTIEGVANMPFHASTRTTQLYGRRPDEVTLDEVEKIQI
jgi:hypothetical protein